MSRKVVQLVNGHAQKEGAGVEITRVFGPPQAAEMDPFLMLDEFKNDDPNAYSAGFPDHPHRGFETVTYMLVGKMRHKDNHGNEGVVGPGGSQWMTAAHGVIHSEMPEQDKWIRLR